ncbi:MAG: hypothetical protein ACRDCE_20295 [Cetobacterium sp.]|uniref:hypothetical protein n=1 Tax=Cetobacterium sp. TaxID=2071632 RepID=UPI003EE42DD3
MSNFNSNEDDVYNVPHISQQLADHLKDEFSADRQIADGLLSDPKVVRSEAFMLGYLAGLGFARQVIDVMIANQQAIAEESNLMTNLNDADMHSFIPNM